MRAFFTTRSGGVSTGPYASLNLGRNVEDEPRAVETNLEKLDELAGAGVVLAAQVHGATVLTVGGPVEGRLAGTGDGLVTTTAVPIAVVVADCVPVLLADPDARVVAAAHAGRPGLVAGIVANTVAQMRALGAERINAVLGPAICGDCYEVPAAMRDEVDAVVPSTASTTSWSTPGLDLPAGVTAQLRAAGVERIERIERCTFTDDDLYSHRRFGADGSRRGRFAGVVRLG